MLPWRRLLAKSLLWKRSFRINLSLGGGALGNEARGLKPLFWGDLVWASGEGEGRGFPQTNSGPGSLCPAVKLHGSCHAAFYYRRGVARGWLLDTCIRAANPESHRASCPRSQRRCKPKPEGFAGSSYSARAHSIGECSGLSAQLPWLRLP